MLINLKIPALSRATIISLSSLNLPEHSNFVADVTHHPLLLRQQDSLQTSMKDAELLALILPKGNIPPDRHKESRSPLTPLYLVLIW